MDRFDDLPAIPKTENTQKKTKKKKSKNREIAEKTQAVQVMDEAMKNTNDAEKVSCLLSLQREVKELTKGLDHLKCQFAVSGFCFLLNEYEIFQFCSSFIAIYI